MTSRHQQVVKRLQLPLVHRGASECEGVLPSRHLCVKRGAKGVLRRAHSMLYVTCNVAETATVPGSIGVGARASIAATPRSKYRGCTVGPVIVDAEATSF